MSFADSINSASGTRLVRKRQPGTQGSPGSSVRSSLSNGSSSALAADHGADDDRARLLNLVDQSGDGELSPSVRAERTLQQVIADVKSVEAGIVIAIAKLQTHCSNITSLQNQLMGSSVDTFQELTLEREQAASTFNHLRSLFAELTQLQQLVPEHLQSWLQARFQPLFIDYGFVVSEFELLCFPYSDQYSNTRLDRENSLDLSSVTTSAERTELIENKQREQELDRSRRRDEIVHQLEQMAEDERQVLDSRNPLIEEQLRQRRARQEQLERELMELNSMFFDLQHFVQKSASVVTRLEQQVEETKSQVAAGTKELSKAAKIQAVMYPLLFGIVGGAIAGPVGLVAGLKGGGLMSAAALGAGVGAGAGVGVKALRDKFVDQHTPKQSHPSQIAMVNEMAGILIEESPTRPALTVHEKVR